MDVKTLEKKIAFIDEYKNAKNAASGSAVDANANVTQKNIATLQTELSKKDIIAVRRRIVGDYLTKHYGETLSNSYLEDLKNHIIYANDETSLMPYCASVSLYPFLINGLKDLGGSSNVPQHANSFIGGMINLLFLVAGQFAGAIAIPEFLTYFDHFLRKDYGDDYIDKLDVPIEVWGNRQETLRKKIKDWFQQFIYSINQPAGARNYQSPFTNIAYFDKYYFESMFNDFVFPDGDKPMWETTKTLQKMFMLWFNNERLYQVLTFPVETFNILVEDGKYKDTETADFIAEMWSLGHSFFCYQSDSVDALASCCRLRNEVEDNVFSYTLGAGGVQTGSKCVVTMNLNRIIQDWDKRGRQVSIQEEITAITQRVHAYLDAWNLKLWDDFNAGLLTVYSAGFIDLDKQFLTVGINGFVEAAEYLGIKTDPFNPDYQKFAADILGTIKQVNKANRTKHRRFNTEMIPAENAAGKLYGWDKQAGYKVPESRVLYNSYFYVVEDETIDPVKKFYYQGNGFATECDGGVALHNNLSEHLTKKQYRYLMDVAVKAGCNYWTYNIPNTVCNECGYISKNRLDSCENCGSKNIDYAVRIIGYLKRISNFSEIRQKEASMRAYSHTNKEDELDDTTFIGK